MLERLGNVVYWLFTGIGTLFSSLAGYVLSQNIGSEPQVLALICGGLAILLWLFGSEGSKAIGEAKTSSLLLAGAVAHRVL